MSPLAKQVIDALSNESDNEVLAEVLDFYGYLKEKKRKQFNDKWSNIEEDDPSKDEVEIINRHLQNGDTKTISLNDLAEELGLND